MTHEDEHGSDRVTSASDQSVSQEDCSICGWNHATLWTQAHRRRCKKWSKAKEWLGFLPMSSTRCTAVIAETTARHENAASDEDRFGAAMDYARALFDRSLGWAIDNRHLEDHPGFEEYVGMLDMPIVAQTLRKKFPEVEGQIASGFTLWEPENSSRRKRQFRMAKHHSSHG